MAGRKPTIVFCGTHRVNFAMFHPVYEKLRHEDSIELKVSSGRYRKRALVFWLPPRDPDLRNERLFAEFNVDKRHLFATSNRDKTPYEVYVTSNRSRQIQPEKAQVTVQIFHGVSFRNFSINKAYTRFTKLFFAGRYHADQYVARGILEAGDPRIELMGLPKLDCLVDGSIRREEVLREYGLDPALPTVLWCPTGARFNSFEALGAAGVRAAQDGEWNFIMKLHDHPHLPEGMRPGDLERAVKAALGPRGRLATKSNVAPLLAAADLLISDASSVANEYCLRDRPIVFVDVPELLAHRAAMEGCAMDLDTHGRKTGRVVKGPGELTEAIRHGLGNPGEHSAERRATAEHLFHLPGTATERMKARLLEFARDPSSARR